MPFVRFFLAKFEEYKREQLWKTYVAESLHLIPQGSCLERRYVDLLKNEYDLEEKTGDKIAAQTINALHLKQREV